VVPCTDVTLNGKMGLGCRVDKSKVQNKKFPWGIESRILVDPEGIV
jgi:hypothetical protein